MKLRISFLFYAERYHFLWAAESGALTKKDAVEYLREQIAVFGPSDEFLIGNNFDIERAEIIYGKLVNKWVGKQDESEEASK